MGYSLQLQRNRESYARHREKHLARAYRWRENNPESYRQYQRIYRGLRRTKLKRSADGSVTKVAIEQMFIEQEGQCKRCECDIKDNYHIDHKIPVSRGGLHTIENIQLLCPPCNQKKYNHLWN